MEYDFKIGDRVYYKDVGPEDTGTVKRTAMAEGRVIYVVSWDYPGPTEPDGYYAHELRSVGVEDTRLRGRTS